MIRRQQNQHSLQYKMPNQSQIQIIFKYIRIQIPILLLKDPQRHKIPNSLLLHCHLNHIHHEQRDRHPLHHLTQKPFSIQKLHKPSIPILRLNVSEQIGNFIQAPRRHLLVFSELGLAVDVKGRIITAAEKSRLIRYFRIFSFWILCTQIPRATN